jgi:hypothetical protein
MPIQRKDKELTDECLLQMIDDDIVGRNADLRAFLTFLDEVEGGISLFLDGSWGSGKTVFVKQATMLLKSIFAVDAGKDGLSGKAADIIKKHLDDGSGNDYRKTYLPVYFNAWENDVYSDPVVTLLGTLITESGLISFAEEPTDLIDKVLAVGDAILKGLKLDILGDLHEGFKAKDLRDSMDSIRAIQDNFRLLVAEMLRERADRLVLFIDELDRCNPAFALMLLERVKFILTMDNVIVVFSTNVSQLAHTVEGYYGGGFDGSKYLTRYYDKRLALSEVKASSYIRTQVLYNNYQRIAWTFVDEILDANSFSMRDCNRYIEDIETVINRTTSNTGYPGTVLLTECLFPVVVALRLIEPIAYSDVMSGAGEQYLFEHASRCPSFERYLNKWTDELNYDRQDAPGGPIEHTPREFFNAVYRFAFKEHSTLTLDDRTLRAFLFYNQDIDKSMLATLFTV